MEVGLEVNSQKN